MGRRIAELSQREALLKAAAGLAQPFDRTALVVAVWRESPSQFGLPGCEDSHPSDHRVQSALYSKNGPLAKGEMEKVGGKFMLTQAGRDLLAADLEPGEAPQPLPLAAGEVERMLRTTAYRLFDSGSRAVVTERQAEDFWRLPTSNGFKAVDEKVRKLLNGRERPEERLIGACHDWLLERFRRQLTRRLKR